VRLYALTNFTAAHYKFLEVFICSRRRMEQDGLASTCVKCMATICVIMLADENKKDIGKLNALLEELKK